VKMSISIMAHPDREEFVKGLLKEVGGTIPVAMDRRGEGSWSCARKAWTLHDKFADYHLVLQDDAIPCSNFRERAISVLPEERSMAVSLFMAASNPKRTEDIVRRYTRGETSWVSPYLYNGVAIALPIPMILPMIDWVDDKRRAMHRRWGLHRSDGRIFMYLHAKGIQTFYPIPCLVDHRDSPSIVGTKAWKKGRGQAVLFIDEGA
jgi:hypothetical protein